MFEIGRFLAICKREGSEIAEVESRAHMGIDRTRREGGTMDDKEI